MTLKVGKRIIFNDFFTYGLRTFVVTAVLFFALSLNGVMAEVMAAELRIPSDFRSLPPFQDRFVVVDEHTPCVIDLEAVRFLTCDDHHRLLSEPSHDDKAYGSFVPELIRPPFTSTPWDLFIVQAANPEEQEALARHLHEMEIRIRGYIPRFSYLVVLERSEYEMLLKRPEVSWIGLYQPGWRIAPRLDYVIEKDPFRECAFTALFDSLSFTSDKALKRLVESLGFRIINVTDRRRGYKLRLSGPAIAARHLAQQAGLVWIELYRGYQLDNNIARTSTDTATGRGAASGPLMDVEDVWERGLRGEGEIVALSDTGLSTGDFATIHKDFGEQGSPDNPLRIIAAYALGRATWDDDQAIPGAGHGTHVSGSLTGNGYRSGSDPYVDDYPSSSYAGTAPKAQLVFQSILDAGGGLGGIPSNLIDLFQPPYDDGARVHNNSWSSPVDGQYTADSQEVDEFVWNHPDMVITYTAGNRGEDGATLSGPFCSAKVPPPDGIIDTDGIGAPGTAKNCITVGTSENYRPDFVFEHIEGDCISNDGIEQKTWGWFSACKYSLAPVFSDLMADDASGLGALSSRGPTDDGRFKPELVAPGVAVISTRTDQNQAYQQWGTCNVPSPLQQYYIMSGGTSMAAPLTAGSAALVRQYYNDGWHGEGKPYTNLIAEPGDSFNPSAALVKATLINGAWDMAPGQYGGGPTQELPPTWDAPNDLPNNAEGYGRVDVETALFQKDGFGRDPGRDMEIHDVSPGLSTGGLNNYNISIAASADPLIVTLVWSDPYALSGAGSKLINDLDLLVISPTATIYYPNGVDLTAGSADRTNNVVQTTVTAPVPGTWTVRVNGFNVPGNGEPGSTVQPYALVVSGILTPPCSDPAAPAGLTATPVDVNRIDLTWNAVAADSYLVYRSTSPGGPYEIIASGLGAPSYSDTAVSGSVPSYYVVTAKADPNCQSAFSNEASATPFGDCSAAPVFTGITSAAAASTGGTCVIRLEWSAADSFCPRPLVYNVYRSTTGDFLPGPANLLISCLTNTFYDDDTATSGTEYFYIVRAEGDIIDGMGPCRSGNEDRNRIELSATVGGDVSSIEFFDDFDGSQIPGDLWNLGLPVINPYSSGSCSSLSYGTDWYRPETGFCAGNTAASNDGAADPAYSVLNYGSLVLGKPPGSGPPFVDGGFVLPSGVTSITLSFRHDYDFDSTSQHWDGGRVRISDEDYPNFTDIVPVGGYPGTVTTSDFFCTPFPGVDAYVDDSGGCVSAQFDLTAYAGSRVWLAWNHGGDNFNSSDDGWMIDNVSIESLTPNPCSTPPPPVSALTATASDGENVVEWLNPTSSYGSTMIRYSTAGPPQDPNDGILLVDRSGTAGESDAEPHQSLSNGTTYFYTAFVDNGSGEYSAARRVSSRPFSSIPSSAGEIQWVYTSGASTLTKAALGSVFTSSNDLLLHSIDPGVSGGSWPPAWTPPKLQDYAPGYPLTATVGATSLVVVSSLDGFVYAFNAQTGAPVWTSPSLGTAILASPVGVFVSEGRNLDLILVGTADSSNDNLFYGLNPVNGAIAWSFDNGGGAQGLGKIATAHIHPVNNTVYFTSRTRSGGSSDTIWSLDFDAVGKTKNWSHDCGEIDQPVSHYNGNVYVGNRTGMVFALDDKTGNELWSAPFATADGPVKGPVVPVSGTNELILSTTNTVWSLYDNTGSPGLKWSLGSVPDLSTPVIGGAYRYWIGSSDGKLYEIDDTGGSPAVTSITLGDGFAAVRTPQLDHSDDLLYVNTDDGRMSAVELTLSFPSETAQPGDLIAARGSGTAIDVTFSPACNALANTVYIGKTTGPISSLDWSERVCNLGNSGTDSLDPGEVQPNELLYFVIVSHDSIRESSYGRDSTSAERITAADPGLCSFTQVLGGTCP